MMNGFPDRGTLAVFAIAAVVCALVVWWMPSPEVGAAVLAMPVFFFSAMLGFFRQDRDSES